MRIVVAEAVTEAAVEVVEAVEEAAEAVVEAEEEEWIQKSRQEYHRS